MSARMIPLLYEVVAAKVNCSFGWHVFCMVGNRELHRGHEKLLCTVML